MIVETLTVGPVQANCYLVGCPETRTAVVIDPGDEAPRILERVRANRLTVTHILLTHAHFDHITAAQAVAEATGAPLAIHPDDLPLLNVGGGATAFGLPQPPIPVPQIWLSAGDVIETGTLAFSVFHTPGHSPGHVCFYEQNQGAVFVGDVLFSGSIGRTDLPGGSYETLVDSIAHQLMVLPDETTVYPGHGPSTTIGVERVGNPFL